jgi:hypothetical protein
MLTSAVIPGEKFWPLKMVFENPLIKYIAGGCKYLAAFSPS